MVPFHGTAKIEMAATQSVLASDLALDLSRAIRRKWNNIGWLMARCNLVVKHNLHLIYFSATDSFHYPTEDALFLRTPSAARKFCYLIAHTKKPDKCPSFGDFPGGYGNLRTFHPSILRTTHPWFRFQAYKKSFHSWEKYVSDFR